MDLFRSFHFLLARHCVLPRSVQLLRLIARGFPDGATSFFLVPDNGLPTRNLHALALVLRGVDVWLVSSHTWGGASHLVINDRRGRYLVKVLLVGFMNRLSYVVRIGRLLGCDHGVITVADPVGLTAFGRRRRTVIVLSAWGVCHDPDGFERARVVLPAVSNVKRAAAIFSADFFHLRRGRFTNLATLFSVVNVSTDCLVAKFLARLVRVHVPARVLIFKFRGIQAYVRVGAYNGRIFSCLVMRSPISRVNVGQDENDVISEGAYYRARDFPVNFNLFDGASREDLAIRNGSGHPVNHLATHYRYHSSNDQVDRAVHPQGNYSRPHM